MPILVHMSPAPGGQRCEAAAEHDGFSASWDQVTCPRCLERRALATASSAGSPAAGGPPRPRGAVRALLDRDHARITGLLDQLLDEVGSSARGAQQEAWRLVAAAIRDHMETEEQYLLELFAVTHPREAAEIQAEHVGLRQALERLGQARDPSAVQAFIASFTAHARRESPLLYQWAEQEVDRSTQVALALQLAARDRATALGR